MARVFIPTLLQAAAGGRSEVECPGATVAEVVDELERLCPGVRARLVEGERLRSNLSVAVDGVVSQMGLREPVGPASEVHFVAAIKGGSSGVQLITAELMAGLIEKAARSPRRRVNHNFHPSLDDPCHRFLNVLLRGTYVTPHRHVTPPKPEAFVLLRGAVAFFLFDDAGEVIRCETLGEGGAIGIDVPPGAWHSMAVLSESAVCYEVKPGPYAAVSDKDFAPWAPREGDAQCAEYLANLLAYCVKSSGHHR